MSLYNMMMQTNPLAGNWLAMLSLTSQTLERLRDAWLQDDGEHGLRIVILTRCGGNNRATYPEMYERLAKHPEHLGDRDADFDNTYAFHDFKIPEEHQGTVDQILEAAREQQVYDKIVDNRTFKQRFDEVMAGLKGIITELHITDPARTPVEWWDKVEAFKGQEKFEFQKAGLTVLWGPNGSGKSSLLKVLAHLTHCSQGGSPLVTNDSLGHLKGRHGDGPRDGASILTDGKPVHFLDPGAEAGLMGGGAAFDYDFMADGMSAMFARRSSSGEQTTAKTNRILKSSSELKEVAWKATRPEKYADQKYAGPVREATKFLTANIEEDGPPTILLDEPGRSLSIPRQAELWHILSQQQRFQIIVATHSVFALYLLGVKYIDVKPGYLQESREEFDTIAKTAALVKKLQKQMAEIDAKDAAEKETTP